MHVIIYRHAFAAQVATFRKSLLQQHARRVQTSSFTDPAAELIDVM